MKITSGKILLPLLLLLLPQFSFGQVTTKSDVVTGDVNAGKKTKILVIPWEPRMYNCSSDISRSISTETSQKFNQIQEALRRGMVDQIKKSFGANYSVASLIDDTAKMNADLYYVYEHTTMSYTPVNFPLNATKADSVKLKQQAGVQQGQIEVSSDDADKFMNTIILSPVLLSYLKKKYNADYVLFFNEVDIDNDLGADPYNIQGKQDFTRSTVLHWTIFNSADGKRVAMGKTKGKFSSTTNSPKKIIDTSFSAISAAIYSKFAAAMKPKP
jgi:hypothetical protein